MINVEIRPALRRGMSLSEVQMQHRWKTITFAAAALVFSSWGASAGTINNNNVSFTITQLNSTTIELTIDNALNATGNWTGIKYLEAFSLVPNSITPGNANISASVTNVAGWSQVD